MYMYLLLLVAERRHRQRALPIDAQISCIEHREVQVRPVFCIISQH